MGQPAAARKPPAAADDDRTQLARSVTEERTVMEERPRTAAKLQRLQPAGRTETIILDRTDYLIGRSQGADVVLFSQTASREHARLSNRAGRWTLQPLQNHTVAANGTKTQAEVTVTHNMRLRFGGDELLFLDESGASAAATGAPSRKLLFIGLGVLLAALAATGVWWFLLE